MLFVIAIFFVPLVTWLVLWTISKRRAKEESEPPTLLEICALCHEEFEMTELIEKEVGEYGRVYCFCGGCIESLLREFRHRKVTGNGADESIVAQETGDIKN
ncbi:MAG: hypothetical protein OXN17_11720 [Candidatus Poribacteria bacterium]|nr:hypothetical protein [Candidatus Poribacteria bacterium]MDE0506173.1 hypothetical protein [Candidatus Poribacteria bacterium]